MPHIVGAATAACDRNDNPAIDTTALKNCEIIRVSYPWDFISVVEAGSMTRLFVGYIIH
jgi:hypothetical protein